jgi:hypothetical protein
MNAWLVADSVANVASLFSSTRSSCWIWILLVAVRMSCYARAEGDNCTACRSPTHSIQQFVMGVSRFQSFKFLMEVRRFQVSSLWEPMRFWIDSYSVHHVNLCIPVCHRVTAHDMGALIWACIMHRWNAKWNWRLPSVLVACGCGGPKDRCLGGCELTKIQRSRLRRGKKGRNCKIQ